MPNHCAAHLKLIKNNIENKCNFKNIKTKNCGTLVEKLETMYSFCRRVRKRKLEVSVQIFKMIPREKTVILKYFNNHNLTLYIYMFIKIMYHLFKWEYAHFCVSELWGIVW